MDIHKNARLSFRSREVLVQHVVERALTLQAAAAAFSVTVKTAAKWVRRYRDLGLAGLYDRSSRPHRSPRRLPDAVIEHVIHLRRHHTPGYQIARSTAISPASISRILRRARLSRWRDLHPAPPVVRYEHAAPGDLLHLDIKGMTRYQQVSIRGDGRRRGRPQFAGWQALHVAIDDHSRLAFACLLPDERTPSVLNALQQAVSFYSAHGIKIQQVLTDRGSTYRSKLFAASCHQLGLKHLFTKPYRPQTNGKAERFIQTITREWAYARSYTSSNHRATFLPHYLHDYNFHRPHSALKSLPPSSRLPKTADNVSRYNS
jgi:transposase InsO family protein